MAAETKDLEVTMSSRANGVKSLTLPDSRSPTGWFQVAWADDIPDCGVRLVHYFGQDIVVWRGESGRLYALDAYCLHLGANLGEGGRVCGEDIECPFHAWNWSGEGRNTLIPYSSQHHKPNLCMKAWPVREWEGCVLAWHDTLGRDPMWEPPDFPAIEGLDWSEYFPVTADLRHVERIAVHPQLVQENTADLFHVPRVHGADAPPELRRCDFNGHSYAGEAVMMLGKRDQGTWLSADGPLPVVLRFGASGIGQGWVVWSDEMAGLFLNGNVTPVDETHSDFFVWTTVKRFGDDPGDGPQGMKKALLDLQRRNLDQDFRIWNNMRPSSVPNLAPEEIPGYEAIRRWAWQFYPELSRQDATAE